MKGKTNSQVIIGIDLGTTFSAVSTYEADGSCKVIPNLDGDLITPSVINLGDEKNTVSGRTAVHKWAYDPEFTTALFKRTMGKCDAQGKPIPAFVHPVSGKAYFPEELSSILLRYLVQGAEAASGAKVGGAVISVPAYFEDLARSATRRAGELAGLKVLRIINEPTAAALAFGLESGEAGTFLVYDLGGGTFDVTILKIRDRNFEVATTDGDANLGGSDIDNLIAAKAVEAFKAQYGIEISPITDLITWHDLLEKSENAKKTLSQSENASFMVSVQDKRMIFDLTRAQFEAEIAPIVEMTKTITERALAAAKLQPQDIKDVILVGGSTRIPAVRKMLATLFGKPSRTDINPDEAVARGAAIFAAKMAGDIGLAVVDSQGKKGLPPILNLTDVNSHPLGCLALVNGVERNCVIIPANSKLPAEKEESFALVQESQTEAKVTITSGAHHADPADCKVYGDVVLTGLPKRSPQLDSIKVKYGFTVEGTLDITITDTVSGKTTSEIKRGLNDIVGGPSQS
jgi:molecular chaperone DnaK